MVPHKIVLAYSAQESITLKQSKSLFNELEEFFDSAIKNQTLYPNARIDNAWHYFLTYTDDYKKYCLKNFDKLIYHIPLSKNNEYKNACKLYIQEIH